MMSWMVCPVSAKRGCSKRCIGTLARLGRRHRRLWPDELETVLTQPSRDLLDRRGGHDRLLCPGTAIGGIRSRSMFCRLRSSGLKDAVLGGEEVLNQPLQPVVARPVKPHGDW